MARIQVGEVALDYEIRGNGEPLLMVCGFRRNRTVWGEALLVPLAERFSLVLLDNRGTGNSDKPQKGYSVETFADDAAGLLEALDIPRAHVFGVSMGGMIGQRIASTYPGKVTRLALGCTACGGPEAVPTREEALALLRLLPSETINLEELAYLQEPAYFTEPYRAANREFLREFFRTCNALPAPNFAVQGHLQAIETFDGARELGAISAPTLVITGAEDVLIPAENSTLLAERIAGAELKILPEAGHFFWVEKAEETAAALIEFFSREG